ncbi:unnamed protein product [Effrenium voratum]|uniref:Uncharacterized protein n=1 Tax=Effrenium voratum TaxID=2562239 RepID=A0AA36NLI8_9DINO|nr:unnamed protein product [Effrenium voratum]CAJ1444449.1 unnamed protein product [Effrenium voratum]
MPHRTPCKRTYYLKFIRYGRLDQAPMVLQDSPKGLQEYMAESKYTTLKERMDNAVLPVYVTARRVQFMMWMSSAVLVMALIVFVVLLLIHVQEDCDDLLGYMLPALLPALSFSMHCLLHQYRKERLELALKETTDQLRGLVTWESRRFTGMRLKLRLEDGKGQKSKHGMHIELTVWLDTRTGRVIDPDDFDFNGQQESGLSCDSFEADLEPVPEDSPMSSPRKDAVFVDITAPDDAKATPKRGDASSACLDCPKRGQSKRTYEQVVHL